MAPQSSSTVQLPMTTLPSTTLRSNTRMPM
jgi:hypothetical protein